jgi:hypothetical protein
MKQRTQVLTLVVGLVIGTVDTMSAQSLARFRSDAELSRYLRLLAPRAARGAFQAQDAVGFAASGERSITNTQHAGVDEGGIVKLHGDYLVTLRRGRLFTIAIGDGERRHVATVDAFGPGVDPGGTWYDELLIAGDKVLVVGYSYQRGGTEVGVFRIDNRGGLHHESTYQLTSNDYYSSRNYASRLVGTKLIFYTPLYLWALPKNPLAVLPAMRHYRPTPGDTGTFRRIVPIGRIYRTGPLTRIPDDPALHTVTTCEVAATPMQCESTVVIGPSGRVFYVSPKAVYVWASSWRRSEKDPTSTTLVRMPLDGSDPTAIGVAGTPVDQFSFLESDDGYLNVLVRAEAYGDAMWAPEISAGGTALLRLPLRTFGDGNDRAPSWRYRPLPAPTGHAFVNRFVGEHLLYGLGAGWGRPQGDTTTLYVVPWAGGRTAQIRLPHPVDRVEVMGDAAVVVGATGQDLHFTGIELRDRVQARQRYVLAGASQGETRSHGFFYRRDDDETGVLGLPVRGPGRPGWEHLIDGSAALVFVRDVDGRFEPSGTLRPAVDSAVSDACRASCVDWYGNARPIFIGERVFALLGYELVEGVIRGGRIGEVGRVGFAPLPRTVAR